jgi:hypothetical protein
MFFRKIISTYFKLWRWPRDAAIGFRLGHILVLVLAWYSLPVLGLDTRPGSERQPQTEQDLSDQDAGLLPGSQYINSLLLDKEIPLIGGRWSGEIMVDAPLNSEPEGAAVTLRRARLRYSRGFGNHWKLKLTADYSRGGGLELSDTYVVYSGWKTALLTFGINDSPYSLESASSSSGLTFMERGMAVSALSEAQSGGITFLKRTNSSIFNGKLVLFNPSQDNLRQSGQGIVLHYVHSPITVSGRDNIHLGGSFSYRANSQEDNTQFRSRPEIATSNTYFVDTGAIDGADKVIRASLEASRVSGRLS